MATALKKPKANGARHAGQGIFKRPIKHAKPKALRREERRQKQRRAGVERVSLLSEDAEPSFPLREWMVPATDAHGHSAKVFCRCPPSYKHQIGKIIQDGKFPWETESDLVRVAVHRLLDEVAKALKDPEITSQQAILNSLVEMASQQMEYSHFKDTLEKLEVTVKELLSNDAAPMARKVVRAVADQIDNFEETFWKERYRKQIVKEYGGLLK